LREMKLKIKKEKLGSSHWTISCCKQERSQSRELVGNSVSSPATSSTKKGRSIGVSVLAGVLIRISCSTRDSSVAWFSPQINGSIFWISGEEREYIVVMPTSSHPARAPPKIGKNMIFWRKIVIFHTRYLNNFRASLRNWKNVKQGSLYLENKYISPSMI
jgi:hypothetical protein